MHLSQNVAIVIINVSEYIWYEQLDIKMDSEDLSTAMKIDNSQLNEELIADYQVTIYYLALMIHKLNIRLRT